MELDFLDFGSNDSNHSAYDVDLPLQFNQYTDCKNSNIDLGQFFYCMGQFIFKSLLPSCFYFIFSLSTAFFNLLVVVLISRQSKTKTVFDKIFIGHAFVDFLVGLFVIPLFCIYTVFGYWPFGKLMCQLYISLDYTICHVGISHMVFLSYARLRSLISPKTFSTELIIHNCYLTILALWGFSALLWIPSVVLITNSNYKNRECFFTFDPIFIIIQDIVAYIIPMLIILVITLYIIRIIRITKKKKKTNGLTALNRAMLKGHRTRLHSNISTSNNENIESSKVKYGQQYSYGSENSNVAIEDNRSHINVPAQATKRFLDLPVVNVSAYAKLYIIVGTFCALWLPFCILWPVRSVSPNLIAEIVYTTSYWLGYAQSLINPILLLILNQNYGLRTHSTAV